MKFCSECGNEIDTQQKFCSYCGSENKFYAKGDNKQITLSKRESDSYTSTQRNTIFNHDVLVNYLNNLQTLEFVKRKKTQDKKQLKNKISSLGHAKNICKRKRLFDCGSPGGVVGMAIIFVVALLINSSISVEDSSDTVLTFAAFLIGMLTVLSGLAGIGFIVYGIWEYIKDIIRYKTDRKNEVDRIANELIEKERLEKTVLPLIEKDIEKTTSLLNDAYAINIVPAKFRNIYGAYFLYENVSTSMLTLSEVLIHCVLEEISKKLDVVIEQQQQMIMQQAEMIYLSEHIIRQNEELLDHAIATEHNTALAAQYAQVSAVNTATVANIQGYFQTKDLYNF